MTESSLLAPLSILDHSGVDAVLCTFSYVLAGAMSPTQIEDLRSACTRVVDKYRLLAGHVEPLPAPRTGFFGIRVPLGAINVSSRLNFTVDNSRRATTFSLIMQGREGSDNYIASQVGDYVLPQPPAHFFHHKSATGSLAALAKSEASLLNVHLTLFADCTCIGIAAAHGIFDGKGVGMVVAGIDAELHGRPWTPPSFGTTNVLQTKLDAWIAEADLVNEQTQDHSQGPLSDLPMLQYLKREWVPTGLGSVARLASHIGIEYLWHKAEARALFLSRESLDAIVAPIKAEVLAKDPNLFVSTSDILLMWFIRAAHSRDIVKDSQKISVTFAVCMRETLCESLNNAEVDFKKYPHMSSTTCSLPLLSKKDVVQASPLGDLALVSRRCLDEMRNTDFIKAWVHYMHKAKTPLVPARGNGYEAWIASNQIAAHITNIDFGLKMCGYFFIMSPLTPDHTVLFNELHDGILLQSTLRREQWRAVDATVAQLGKSRGV